MSRQTDDQWNLEECLREFLRLLREPSSDAQDACVRAIERLQCWREAFAQILSLPFPDEKLARALFGIWISRGFRIGEALRGDPVLVDAFRHLFPRYQGPAHRLYRGELESRYRAGSCGFAWTPLLDVAEMFASRREALGEGLGIVLSIEATSESIIATHHEHSKWLQELEYILDMRTVAASAVTVIPRNT